MQQDLECMKKQLVMKMLVFFLENKVKKERNEEHVNPTK